MAKFHNKYVPRFIGMAEFANGTKFQLDQVNAKGAVKIIDLNSGSVSYARTYAKAWANIRYQARIHQVTERSLEA